MPPDPIYDLLEQRLAGWAAARSDILAAIVVGSRARSDHPADPWSDLDLILFVTHPAWYEQPGDWQDSLRAALALPVWLSVFERTGAGDPEWDYVLDGAAKVDLVFTPNRSPRGSAASLAEMIDAFPYRYVIEHGMRALVAKTLGLPVVLNPPPYQFLPDQAQFDALVHQYLLDILRAVKFAKRGELWRAAQVINTSLQAKLLTLLVWHAASGSLPGGVPYYRGRFLEEWASPHLLAVLKDTFAAYSSGGIEHAISGAFLFLSTVTDELCAATGLSYPKESVDQVRRWALAQISRSS